MEPGSLRWGLRVDGALFEVGRHYKHAGLFQLFFKHRAVALSNGRIAVESFNSVWFTSGKVTDDLPGGRAARDFCATLGDIWGLGFKIAGKCRDTTRHFC